jgi:hypothetical protein
MRQNKNTNVMSILYFSSGKKPSSRVGGSGSTRSVGNFFYNYFLHDEL